MAKNYTFNANISCTATSSTGYSQSQSGAFTLNLTGIDQVETGRKNITTGGVDSHKKEINEYLIVGHTDTKGTKKYNLSLSIKRANVVKELLINYGIDNNKIKILGRGENQLAIITPDETRQPANRRVEIKKTN